MKKAVFILITMLVCCMYVRAEGGEVLKNLRLLNCDYYKNLSPENVKSLKVLRYTEAGISEKSIDEKNEINQVYNFLKKIKISDEVKMGCTDNTTVYQFTLKDNSKVSVEIECDWLVIKGKNYNFVIEN